MLPTIDFNDQLAFKADKIDDVGAKWNLSLKFYSAKTVSAKPIP